MHEGSYDDSTKLLNKLEAEESTLRISIQLLQGEIARITAEQEVRERELRKLARTRLALVSPQSSAPLPVQLASSKEIDLQLRDLLALMSKLRVPLLPVRGHSPTPTLLLAVHTVKINFIKHLEDGQIERFSTGIVSTAVFRLTQATTLEELKEVACRYWDLQSSKELTLRWNVGTRLNLVENGPVHRLFEEHLLLPELWLLKSNPRCNQLFPGQEECYTRDFATKRPKLHLTTEQAEKGIKSNLRALAKRFPALPLHPRPPKVQPKRPLSCPTCSSSLLLLLLTALLVAFRSDTHEAFMLQRAITAPLLSVEKLSSFKDLSFFFSSTLPAAFFPGFSIASGMPRLEVPMIIGPLRLRQLRSRATECPSSLTNYTCYLEYSAASRETGDLISGVVPWKYFRSDTETKISSTIWGKVSDYDGSGYLIDVYSNATVEDFRQMWYSMEAGGWLDPSVRALICSVVGYEPSTDLWWHLDLLIEMSISGGIIPAPLMVETFHPQPSSAVLALEVFRFLCSFHLLYYMATEFAQRVSLTWRFHWKYFGSGSFLLDLVTFGLIIAEFGLVMSQDLDPVELLRSREFRDVKDHANIEGTAKCLNIVILMLIFLRFTVTFRFQPGFLVAHITMRKVRVT